MTVTPREKVDHALRLALPTGNTDELLALVDRLISVIEDYADHQSWRCEYRSRYGECCCGLDDDLVALGFETNEPRDPEARS